MIECGKSDLHVSGWRSYDADELHVRVRHQFLPVIRDVFDTKLLRDGFGPIAVTTSNGDKLHAHAVAKTRDLRGAGKPRPDNSDSNRCPLHKPILATDYMDCTDRIFTIRGRRGVRSWL